ncbi:MAG TPA: hypothetical protein VIC55_06595 [Gemmatimonadaceae bacterium]|jgi:hypothetical protein
MAVGPQIAGQLRTGREYARRLVEHAPSQLRTPADTEQAIALGYLERHRMGVGGPFRLIDYALADPRLRYATRDSLAWALLARTLDAEHSWPDATVLDSLADSTSLIAAPDAQTQLALIENAVRDTRDPRAGELAVRLAYTLVAAEHRLSPRAPVIAAQVAALERDRDLAKRDVDDLLRAAWHDDADPLSLVPIWRRQHRFRVERPLIEPLPAGVELEAMELAPRLQQELSDASTGRLDRPANAAPSLLGAAAAPFARLASNGTMPPQTPVVVALLAQRGALFRLPPGDPDARWARARFFRHAHDEEALVAEHALVEKSAPGIAVERAALAAAVAMRAYAQESPWFPGDRTPLDPGIASRYGLTAVTFDASVPAAWRPYYREMLSSAVEDLGRVLPSLDLTGLRVHIGANPMRGVALALHDPTRRIIYLPAATSAGAIAHEIAHDLDWQAAETRYAVRGDYATDRAVRDARGGPLAASLRGLTEASLSAADRGAPTALSMRPTEVFARSVDWFVAVSLAHDGRMNGYLSSVEDDLLTGYVTVTPPDVTGAAGSALVNVLDDVAPPSRAVRDWYLTRYGPGRVLSPYDLVRRVLEAPISSPAADSSASLAALVAPVERVRDAVLAIVDDGRCGDVRRDENARLTAARRRMVELAARARAAGIMHARGSALAALDAWRWSALAPYAATRPAAIAGVLGGSVENALANRTHPLDLLRRDSEPALGLTACTGKSSDSAR